MAKVGVWLPLYIGDYLADTGHLTTEQHGAYLLLMFHYWRTGPLPNNPAMLANVARLAGDAWINAWAVLEQFLTLQDDGCFHLKRMDEELHKAGENQEKRTERATKAAEMRWARANHAQDDAPSIPQAMRNECPSPSPSPSPSPLTSPSASGDIPAPLTPTAAPSGKTDPREAIYAQYPRKVGKQGALRAIERAVVRLKAKGRTTREAQVYLFHRVQTYARSPAGNDGDFTPHPATWFNQGRYDDDSSEWERTHDGSNSSRASGSETRGAAVGRVERGIAAVNRAAEQFGWTEAGGDGGPDGRLLPAPGNRGGNGGGVHARPEQAGGETRADNGKDGTTRTAHTTEPEVLSPSERSSRGVKSHGD